MCEVSEFLGVCIPGCEIFEFLGSLCHGVSGLLACLCSHFELSGCLGICILDLGSPSLLVWSVQDWKCLDSLWVLHPGFGVLNPECELSELFKGSVSMF